MCAPTPWFSLSPSTYLQQFRCDIPSFLEPAPAPLSSPTPRNSLAVLLHQRAYKVFVEIFLWDWVSRALHLAQMFAVRTPISLVFKRPASMISNSLSISMKPSFLRPSSLSLRSHKARIPAAATVTTTVRSLFTGIVEEMGRIEHLGASQDGGFEMRIAATTVLGGVQLGDSIAVNGTCLTVSEFDPAASHFTVGLSPETLRKTSLAELGPGSPVNLERALQPTSRMGGHFVQGHVDGTGEIVSIEPEGDSLWLKVRAPPELLRYVVPKGFITVDGTSLTVVRVYEEEGCFDFMLVAYTQQKVVIALKKVGDKVNLEVDILGKYVEKLLKSGLTPVDSGISS